MADCTETTLRDVIRTHGGVLKAGAHSPESGECCILEARALCLGLPMTDKPETVGMPDFRPLNDARWSTDALRTEWMIKVAVALSDWATWTPERRQQWVVKVAIATVQQIISALPGLTVDIREQCKRADTLGGAHAAADAAAYADSAAYADAAATVLITACTIWIEAVQS